MTTPYEAELEQLNETVRKAIAAPIDDLKQGIAATSQSSVIGVGSGGSYTVASLLCSLHEAYTGRISRPITPLELICNPTLASGSPLFFFSAEGKNPDIIEALQRARQHSSRAVHVLTNRETSPLMGRVDALNDVTSHVFSLVEKDGYLATNSLAYSATLVARAFKELDGQGELDLTDLSSIRFGQLSLQEWVDRSRRFMAEAQSRRGLIIIYSPLLRPIAEDLESRFSESALFFVQLADFRSFAHGRHLWLTERPEDTAILILSEPNVEGLWEDMKTRVPSQVVVFEMSVGGASPSHLISGLIGGMYLVSEAANALCKNIAKPMISDLGRHLYYADLQDLIPPPAEEAIRGEDSKYEVLGAHWPSAKSSGKIRRARIEAENSLQKQRFKAIVFDYDGTICSSSARDKPPSESVCRHIEKLAAAGIVIGIASGRGGSIAESFEKRFDKSIWPQIRLGLYNGGWIGTMGTSILPHSVSSDFLIHAKRIVTNLKSCGVPIQNIRENPPYQLSVRFSNGVSTEDMWFVFADALKHAGLETATISRSKHSIDILSEGVSKSHLIANIIQECRIDPYEIVTMGDLGAWPGNDAALLQHRYSLSVDSPSRRLDRGWKLAPKLKRDVDATIWYLDRTKISGDRTFRFDISGDAP
ncbi:HAD superfamily hydrolase (TIGR01484 family) [Rhodobium orientis]|uniref:HAD hydrolase family protein n=1 Tax=Rhodobium orientis TaxID=34017 RepID=UPI000DADA274|nr:HAD hydrolase family protein [Rhodobium orientis]MBB4302861.1 HAD superfamily hydrolase (TIGR01484 family) [Rhodobium orientis]